MNLLMLRYSGGYEHSYLPDAEVAIKDTARRLGDRITTTHKVENMKPDVLAKTDLLIFATTGELPLDDSQKKLLLDFVRDGKGFFGIHNACDTSYKWPEYGEMLGGYFNGHPWTQEVTIKVEDRDHPATRHLDETFKVKEEVYVFKQWDRKKTHVLMSLDNSTVDLSKGKRDDHDYAMGWCHEYGKGRVIYTALGHFDELWHQPWFHGHLEGCIKWATRRA